MYNFRIGEEVILKGSISDIRYPYNDEAEILIKLDSNQYRGAEYVTVWENFVIRADHIIPYLDPPIFDRDLLGYLTQSDKLFSYIGAATILINKNKNSFSDEVIVAAQETVKNINAEYKQYRISITEEGIKQLNNDIHSLYSQEQIESNQYLNALDACTSGMLDTTDLKPYLNSVISSLINSVNGGEQ